MQQIFKKRITGFTIVELLVVIVVIAILATITIVSYTGISTKATAAVIQSDLDNASKRLKMYQATYGVYPTALDMNKCPSSPTADSGYCLQPSSGDSYSNYASNGTSFFTLAATNTNGISYVVTNDSSPKITTFSPTNWLTIGTQTWAKANLNVGTMVTGVTAQTNNGGTNIVEKYCYNNLESNCTTYGALYQWNEAMQYVTTEGAQGICPIGSHIPTDNDWKILEMRLGMTQAQADMANTWRGTDQGTQLKPGGSSWLNIPLAGGRFFNGGFFFNLSSGGSLLSSSESGTSTWIRDLLSNNTTILREVGDKAYGFSIRCLGN